MRTKNFLAFMFNQSRWVARQIFVTGGTKICHHDSAKAGFGSPILTALSVLLLAFLVARIDSLRADTNDPSAELASFKIAEGYEVNLFASETDGIANPIQCR